MSESGTAVPFTLHHGDARVLSDLFQRIARDRQASGPGPIPLLQATITSPPYGRLVDYGVDNQIGHGQTEDEYLADCRAVFETVFHWSRQSAVLWLVADSFLDPSVARGMPSRFRPLPFTLAELAESVGWTLREVIVWHKDRTRPWSHHGKLRNAFEYVLLLVKSKEFPFHLDRLRDSSELSRWWVQYPERYHAQGKAPDNVWNIPIPVQGSWAKKAYQHACPLPVELVRRMLELTTEPGDVVFDPFGGIGTVVATANALRRRGFGTEINPNFVSHYRLHVRHEVEDLLATEEERVGHRPVPEIVALLRALKYPKSLFAAYRREDPSAALPSLAIVNVPQLELSTDRNTLSGVEWIFLADAGPAELEHMQGTLKELGRHAPFSKFGVIGDIRVVAPGEARRILEGRSQWFAYEHGRTWHVSRTVGSSAEALAIPSSSRRGKFIPIIGSHEVNVDLDLVGDPAADDPNR